MTAYAYAECKTDFPPDDIADDEGETTGGQRAATAIAQILRDLGYRVEGPRDVGLHGWDLDVFVDRKRVWFEVQGDSDEFWLQAEAMVGILGRLVGADLSHYRDLMRRLNQALRADPHFREINWFAGKKGQSAGPALSEPPV